MNAVICDSRHTQKYQELQEMYPDLVFLEDAAVQISKATGKNITKSYLQSICTPSECDLGEIKKHPSGLFKKMLSQEEIAVAAEVLANKPAQGKWNRQTTKEKTKAFCNLEQGEIVTAGSSWSDRVSLEGLRQMPKFSAAEAAKELGQDIADIKEILHDQITQGRLRDVGKNAYGQSIYRWQLVDQVEASLGRIKTSLGEQVEREFYPLAQSVRSAQEQVRNADDLLIKASLENERLKEELAAALNSAQGQKEMRQGIELALKDSLATIASQEELIVALNSEKLRMQEEVATAQNQERWANSSFLTAEAALKKAKDKVKELQRILDTGGFTCVDCEIANR